MNIRIEILLENSKMLKMVKNEVLGRIRKSGGYGHLCLGLEINLAGSAEFQPPKFSNIKYLPNITPLNFII